MGLGLGVYASCRSVIAIKSVFCREGPATHLTHCMAGQSEVEGNGEEGATKWRGVRGCGCWCW